MERCMEFRNNGLIPTVYRRDEFNPGGVIWLQRTIITERNLRTMS